MSDINVHSDEALRNLMKQYRDGIEAHLNSEIKVIVNRAINASSPVITASAAYKQVAPEVVKLLYAYVRSNRAEWSGGPDVSSNVVEAMWRETALAMMGKWV